MNGQRQKKKDQELKICFRKNPSAGKSLVFLYLSFLFVLSCARIGSPTGGPKDEAPPEVIKSEPPNYSTGFTGDKILITFDEYFELRNIRQKLVVSPLMKNKPEFKIKGKTLEIKLLDSLQPNRTYAINFGDALVDLHEANPLNNFQFVFATGDMIDSLKASGQVLQAFDGKPADEVVVMLYSNTADSVPLKELPLYISKTDKEGKFALRNLAEGEYKIFVLKDANNNFLFDQPTEAIAFLDTLIRPGLEMETQVRDSTDSIPSAPKHRFVPDNLSLRLFTEVRPNSYLAGAERPFKDLIRLKISEKTDSIRLMLTGLPAGDLPVAPDWYGDADTIDLWITDSLLAQKDTLRGTIWFPAYDSLERLYIRSDTLRLIYKTPPKVPGAPKKEFVVSATPERSRTLDPGQPLKIFTTLPFATIDTAMISLTAGKDSSAVQVPFRLIPDTLKGLLFNNLSNTWINPRQVTVNATLAQDSTYNLLILPGAFTGYRRQRSDSLKVTFKVKKEDLFGALKINLPDLTGPGILELIGAGNKVVASKPLTGPGTVVFNLMNPGKYNARLIIDSNGNGRWDTGRYLLHQQPEEVMVFPKDLNLKANWEIEENWEWQVK